MSLILDGSLGITTPAETVTGNTILGDASTDTLNVGNGGLVKDASGNVGIGTASPNFPITIYNVSSQVQFTNSATGTTSSDGFKIGLGGGSSTDAYINLLENTDLIFNTNATEQARITAAGLLKFNSGYGSVATAYGCRAWVSFNGSGTPAIRGSGNVSSITDNGVGDFTVNFTTAMVDVNYVVCGQGSPVGADARFQYESGTARTTSAYRLLAANNSGALTDGLYINIAAFR